MLSRWDQQVDADLYKGGVFLGCTFGVACTYIWALGILASGQSSTMTGTYSGQFAMEGFLALRWKRWQRVLLTRSIAMAPTFSLAYFSDINNLTGMNDILNAIMSIQLPFAIIPALTFTSSRVVMGRFANGTLAKVAFCCMSAVILAINILFITTYVGQELLGAAYTYFLVAVFSLFYLGFICYLLVFLWINLGWGEGLARRPLVQRLYNVQGFLTAGQDQQVD